MENAPFYFSEIIGQDKAKRLLQQGIDRGRLGQAFLFKGPVGVGKKTMARTFAARLNCRKPEGREPCGRCPSCRKFRSGNHPDFLLVEPDGPGIKIGQIRELKKNLAFAPFEAQHRVVLLSAVHSMRREAANSLLKTLEEPPVGTILILIADEAADLLPTILSRCQIVPFFPLPAEKMAACLVKERGIPGEQAATLAAIAGGSLTRARLLHDGKILNLRLELVTALLGLEPDTPAAIRTIAGLAEAAAALKGDLAEFLELFKLWLYDLLLQGRGMEEKTVNLDLFAAFPDARHRWNETELVARMGLLARAAKELDRNCNANAVCEVLFFALL